MKKKNFLILILVLFLSSITITIFSQEPWMEKVQNQLKTKEWIGTGRYAMLWGDGSWRNPCQIRLVFDGQNKLKYSERGPNGTGIPASTCFYTYTLLSQETVETSAQTTDSWGEKTTIINKLQLIRIFLVPEKKPDMTQTGSYEIFSDYGAEAYLDIRNGYCKVYFNKNSISKSAPLWDTK